MTRKTKKNLIRGLAFVLGLAAVIGAVSFIGKKTNGFADDITLEALTQRDLNPDNLYTYDLIPKEMLNIGNTGYGFSVTVEKDGSFVLDGKYEGEEAVTIPGAVIHLEAGEYTMTSGTSTGLYSIYLQLSNADGTKTWNFDFGNPITVPEDGDYKVLIHIEPDAEFKNKHFYPVIVKGDEAGDFYA